jgi:hypothetical protein
MRLAAGGAPLAVKRKAVNQSTKVRIFLYIPNEGKSLQARFTLFVICNDFLILRVALSYLGGSYCSVFAGGNREGSIRTEPECGDVVRSEGVSRRCSEMETPTETQDDYEIALSQKSQVS